jgi:hypothetical protein
VCLVCVLHPSLFSLLSLARLAFGQNDEDHGGGGDADAETDGDGRLRNSRQGSNSCSSTTEEGSDATPELPPATMTLAEFGSHSSDLLLCDACGQRLVVPLLLDCMHSVCAAHVAVVKSQVECPACK